MASGSRPMYLVTEQKIFVALVREQDKRMADCRRAGNTMAVGVTLANNYVEQKHHITRVDLDRIVRHGIDRGWLDLVDAPAVNGEVANGKPRSDSQSVTEHPERRELWL